MAHTQSTFDRFLVKRDSISIFTCQLEAIRSMKLPEYDALDELGLTPALLQSLKDIYLDPSAPVTSSKDIAQLASQTDLHNHPDANLVRMFSSHSDQLKEKEEKIKAKFNTLNTLVQEIASKIEMINPERKKINKIKKRITPQIQKLNYHLSLTKEHQHLLSILQNEKKQFSSPMILSVKTHLISKTTHTFPLEEVVDYFCKQSMQLTFEQLQELWRGIAQFISEISENKPADFLKQSACYVSTFETLQLCSPSAHEQLSDCIAKLTEWHNQPKRVPITTHSSNPMVVNFSPELLYDHKQQEHFNDLYSEALNTCRYAFVKQQLNKINSEHSIEKTQDAIDILEESIAAAIDAIKTIVSNKLKSKKSGNSSGKSQSGDDSPSIKKLSVSHSPSPRTTFSDQEEEPARVNRRRLSASNPPRSNVYTDKNQQFTVFRRPSSKQNEKENGKSPTPSST